MTKRGLRGPFGASQRVYLPLPILSLIFSIPFLAEGVGAFLSLGLGLQPIPILPEEVHNSYSKRMDGSGGLAKQHEAHTACLLSCAVETDSRKGVPGARTLALDLTLSLSAFVLHRETAICLSPYLLEREK